MILRPIEQDGQKKPSSAQPRPVWDAIEESQKALADADECWLITQPAHSALSGDIAAKLEPSVFGTFDEPTIRAIALHDAGWSGFDSELIRASRAESHDLWGKGGRQSSAKEGAAKSAQPKMISFVAAPAAESATAWTGSVDIALKASAVGGFLVSEHFRSLAVMQSQTKRETAGQMQGFIRKEEARQRALRPKIQLDDGAIARLVDGLRFCDLLSLCLCAGVADAVEFPQHIQQLRPVLRRTGDDTFELRPSPFRQDEVFGFSALRHPRTKVVSSATFLCKITG